MNTVWILDVIDKISQIGMTLNGITRHAFSQSDMQARAYLKKLIDDMTTLEFETLFSDKDRLQKKYPFELIMLNQMLSAKSIYWEKHGLIPIWTTIAELPTVLLGLR